MKQVSAFEQLKSEVVNGQCQHREAASSSTDDTASRRGIQDENELSSFM